MGWHVAAGLSHQLELNLREHQFVVILVTERPVETIKSHAGDAQPSFHFM
jgi:hypothetical protein